MAKPRTAVSGEKGLVFPNHHIESAKLAQNILQRLRFDKKIIKKVVSLIGNHMFYYSPNSPLYDARKLVSKVGWDNIYDLIELRVADRIASGFTTAYGPGLIKLMSDLQILKDENMDYKIKDLAVTAKT